MITFRIGCHIDIDCYKVLNIIIEEDSFETTDLNSKLRELQMSSNIFLDISTKKRQNREKYQPEGEISGENHFYW